MLRAGSLRIAGRVPASAPDGSAGVVRVERDGVVIATLPYTVDRAANAPRPDVTVPTKGAPTIQAAVADAVDGNQDGRIVIAVRAGLYRESVVIDRTLELIGEGRALTILQGDGSGPVLTATAPNVVVRGVAAVGGRAASSSRAPTVVCSTASPGAPPRGRADLGPLARCGSATSTATAAMASRYRQPRATAPASRPGCATTAAAAPPRPRRRLACSTTAPPSTPPTRWPSVARATRRSAAIGSRSISARASSPRTPPARPSPTTSAPSITATASTSIGATTRPRPATHSRTTTATASSSAAATAPTSTPPPACNRRRATTPSAATARATSSSDRI